jgi:nitrile hydratase subunit beta
MNGIHDMGGMEGLGEIGYQESEPIFHEPWEGRVHALAQAMQLGSRRPYIERIPAPDYLRMSYYERWYTALVTQLIESGVVTATEVESGRADPASMKATPAITPAVARELLFRTPKTEQNIELTPRFRVGDRVRGRNIHPTTHTRMPRYTRGKTGVVARDRGVFILPDSEQGSAEPKPQHVYLIHFTAQELWGERTSGHDSLYIDMWEDYLEPA